MPRQAGIAIENNFSNGLITEASGLTFPENACTATENCVHEPTGNVLRRLGFDFEINHSLKEIDRTEKVVVHYLWRDVSGDGNITLVVKQIGDHLYFYDGSTPDPLSGHPITDNVDLTDFSPSGAPAPDVNECQFASGNGKLFVTHPYLEAFSVEYDPNTETFTATQIDLLIRDFEGLDDGLAIDNRPTATVGSMSTAHHYNLLNQGWTSGTLSSWDGARTDMPSNCDVVWSFKNSSDAFDTSTIANGFRGNSPAPKGHYILNVYSEDRQTASGLTILTQTTGTNRASTVAFFAGRVFYAGINYVGKNSNVYFSQIIERDEQYGHCYQSSDPTSEDAFELLPTDGGVIEIQEAGTILKMLAVPGGLTVFASNGIWLISGSTGIGFTATDYTVTKLSSISALTHTSFVDLNGAPVWWNLEGIYRLEGAGNSFQVTSLTESKVKTFYNEIPPSEKRNARGAFNPIEGIVQYLYRSTEAGSLSEYYEYDRILNIDLSSQAFYVWTIPTSDVKVHGVVVLENRGGNVSLEDVIDNSAVTVTADDTSDVQVWTIGDAIVTPTFKYSMSYDDSGYQFTYGEARRTDYTDFVLYDDVGEDYESFFITGYRIRGEAIRDFQSNYVTFYSSNDSKYAVRGIWDFANTVNSGRWSNSQTVDATGNSNFDIIPRRRKIRGRGKVLQIRIGSVTATPFDLLGWSILVSANDVP